MPIKRFRLLAMLCACVLLVGGVAVVSVYSLKIHKKMSVTALYHTGLPWETAKRRPSAFIMHAGGGIDGHNYTNSREAVLLSIANGAKMIELDLLFTSDGHLVAAHDWESFNNYTGHAEMGDAPPDLQDFMKRKLHGRYTPLAAADINEIFSRYGDLALVTDKISKFTALVETFPFADRIYVEVFGLRAYKRALAAGIRFPMLSVRNKKEFRQAVFHNIPIVVMSAEVFAAHPEECARLHGRGVAVYVFSTNREEFMRANISRTITGCYTDSWSVRDGRLF